MTKIYSYDEWKNEFHLDEKDYKCPDCKGTGKTECLSCDGSGVCSCRECGNEHTCGSCKNGLENCPECTGYGQTLYFAYLRMKEMQLDLLRKWNGVTQ
jgi:hypothetical protein